LFFLIYKRKMKKQSNFLIRNIYKMINYDIFSSYLTTGIIFALISFNSMGFNPTKFICKNYLLNLMLFLALSISLIMSSILTIDYFKKYELIRDNFWLIIIISFLIFMYVLFSDSKNILLKMAMYSLLFILTGLQFSLLYERRKELFNNTLVYALVVMFIFSIFSYYNPDFVSPTVYKFMLYSLVGLILFYLGLIIKYYYDKKEIDENLEKYISVFGIGLFILYIIYDMNVIYKGVDKCRDGIVDYTSESLGIVYDFLNLFLNMFSYSK